MNKNPITTIGIIDIFQFFETKTTAKPPKSAGKKVSRVIVLYADRTFESFTEF